MLRTAVILLNWKRPQNIGRIVRTASEALPGATVLIIDQAEPGEKLAGRSDIAFDRCWIRSQENAGPMVRFKLAAELPFERYLCIDDDVFLSVDQIRRLMRKLEEAPEAAHGVGGMIVAVHAEEKFCFSFTNREGPISVLSEVYAFTRQRAEEAMRLATTLGYGRWEDIGLTDDMLLSAAGPSVIHNFGPVRKCRTRSDERTAVHLRSQFDADRRMAYGQLLRRKLLYIESSSERLDTSRMRRI